MPDAHSARPTQLPTAGEIARHCHFAPYATLVLEGGYEEAGDVGRLRVTAGDIVLHGPFSAHRDRVSARRTRVLDLPLPMAAQDLPAVCRTSADIDAVCRLAARDPVLATQHLLDRLSATDRAQTELPDQLADAFQSTEAVCIGDWAQQQGRARESVSRDFHRLYGVAPVRIRNEARARMAWRMIASAPDSLARIAAACGFADQPHMTREVRALTGRTPAAWRSHFFKTAA